MANWLQRMFTLPKAKNSLADVLGEDRALVVRYAVSAVLDRELSDFFKRVNPDTKGLTGLVVGVVHRALGGIIPQALAGEIEAAVTAAMARVSIGTPATAAVAVRQAVMGVLKL